MKRNLELFFSRKWKQKFKALYYTKLKASRVIKPLKCQDLNQHKYKCAEFVL